MFFLSWPQTLLGIATLAFLVSKLQKWVQSKDRIPLPPQPPGLPFLGNMLDVISATKTGQQHLLFANWARKYGEVVRVEAGFLTQYFINSDSAVKEIFDEHSSATSERPRWIVSNEQICNEKNVLLLSASHARWRQQRNVALQGITSISHADAGISYLHFETAKFLDEVANDPTLIASSEGLFNSIGRYTYSMFASQTFGMDLPNADDPAIDYILKSGLKPILGTLPGAPIVDMLSILDLLPLLLKPWERKARALFQDNLKWCLEQMQRVQTAHNNNIVSHSFIAMVLQDEEKMSFEDTSEAAYLALMLIIGAADTSKMSTWSFLEAMMQFPEVQETAQNHIEAVVSIPDHPPVYENLEKDSIRSIPNEKIWRWQPPVALGHPHTTTKELLYGGYRIPNGSRIHLNAWAIGNDPSRYLNPERFRPKCCEGNLTTSEQSKNASHPK